VQRKRHKQPQQKRARDVDQHRLDGEQHADFLCNPTAEPVAQVRAHKAAQTNQQRRPQHNSRIPDALKNLTNP
jgi:hypothetical protein